MEDLEEQIDRLAKFLMENYPKDIKEGGAVDVAISILKDPVTNVMNTTDIGPNQRLRVNAKANSKGEYQLDCTFEDTALSVDAGETASKCVDALDALSDQMREGGYKIAGA